MDENYFMDQAFEEAVAAGDRGECPVGAVLVKDGIIVARAGNEELQNCDPTAHAEILCLRRAGEVLGTHVLEGCTMYTTLWPCPMCKGAILQARISTVVSGATTFKWILEERFNSDLLQIKGPTRQAECRRLFIEWAEKNNRLEILAKEEEG